MSEAKLIYTYAYVYVWAAIRVNTYVKQYASRTCWLCIFARSCYSGWLHIFRA